MNWMSRPRRIIPHPFLYFYNGLIYWQDLGGEVRSSGVKLDTFRVIIIVPARSMRSEGDV